VLAAPTCRGAEIDILGAEFTFQAVHGIDLEQTLQARHYPRLSESTAPWAGGWLIGRHPSDRSISAYMAGEATLHAAVTVGLLEVRAPGWLIGSWEAVTIGVDGATVWNNARLIRVQARLTLH